MEKTIQTIDSVGKVVISLTLAWNEFKFPFSGLQIRIEGKQPQQTLMTYVHGTPNAL